MQSDMGFKRSNGSSTATSSSVLATRLIFIAIVVALVAIGLVMIYSSSSISGYTLTNSDMAHFFKRQLIWVAVGIVAAIIFSLPSDETYDLGILVWTAWILLLVAILAVRIFGDESLGATRSIDLGGFSFQPSEFAKVILPIMSAHLINGWSQGQYSIGRLYLMMIFTVGAPVIAIIIQPDLGTTMITLFAVAMVMWFGELPTSHLMILGAAVVILGVLMIVFVGFRGDRIYAWLHPWEDTSSQLANGLYAITEGGVFGVGIGNSSLKYQYLQYPYNDFIFPIICEETGMVGGCVVIVLFLLFVRYAFRIGDSSATIHGRMLACSAGAVLGFQAFLNLMCTTGLFPVTGKPLPFISYGGSSMLSTMMLVGIILSVSLHSSTDSAGRRRDDIQVYSGSSRGAGAGSGAMWMRALASTQLMQTARASLCIACRLLISAYNDRRMKVKYCYRNLCRFNSAFAIH